MKTILAVEDEPDFQKLIRLILEKEGYRVLVEDGAASAWGTICEEQPDLVLLDLNLTDGNGLDLCARLRKEGPVKDLPIIMITVRGDPEDIARGLQVGADDYITKPFRGEDLVVRIEVLFRRMNLSLE